MHFSLNILQATVAKDFHEEKLLIGDDIKSFFFSAMIFDLNADYFLY